MKGYVLYFFIFLLSTGCNNIRNNDWEPYDESYEIKSNENHPKSVELIKTGKQLVGYAIAEIKSRITA